MQSQKKQVLANLLSNYLFTIGTIILGFLVVPFLVNKLGKEAYGIVVLSESNIVFFEILTLSIRLALSRYATAALSKGDMSAFIEHLSAARILLIFSSLIVLFFGLIVSYFFSNLFRVPPQYVSDSKSLFFTVILGFSISIPTIVYWSVVYAKQRFDLINISLSTGIIFRAVSIFFIYSIFQFHSKSLTVYGAIYFSMNLIQASLIYFFHRRLMPGLAIPIKTFNLSRLKEIFSFGMHTSIVRVNYIFVENISNIIINLCWGSIYNTFFSVSLKFPSMVSRVFIDPTWSLMPTFTDLVARGEKDKLRMLFLGYSKILAIASFPICFFLIFFSDAIIKVWMGPGFELSAQIMPIYVLQFFIYIPFSLVGCVLNAFAEVKIQSIVSIFSALFNIVLIIVLVFSLSLKLRGIAWASVFSSTFLFAFTMPRRSCQLLELSAVSYWKESFFKPLFLSGVFFIVGFLINPLFFRVFQDFLSRSFSLIFFWGFLGFLYVLLSYRLLLNGGEREKFNEILSSFVKKLNPRTS